MKKRRNKKNREYGWMGEKKIVIPLLLLSSLFISPLSLFAQQDQLQFSQQFRLGEAIIRIAEPGQLADTVNVWGDVGVTGRYLVPRGTNLTDIISYARGPVRMGTGEADLDRAKFRIEIVVSRDDREGEELKHAFTYRYEESLPADMRKFRLSNGDLVYLQVLRRPTYRDYITIVSPTLTLVLTAILLYDRARQ